MPNYDSLFYNISAFLCSLFVLEKGADLFVDHTAIVGRRTGVPQSLIALLTAGAEWEELAVVVICVARKRPALALGNLLGSGISNIIGAFSLGLILQSPSSSSGRGTPPSFDRSSRIYCIILLFVTAVACASLLLLKSQTAWRILGGCLCAAFAIYVVSIAVGIRKGLLHEPEGSDSDSDSESESENGDTSSDDSDREDTNTERESLVTSARQQPQYTGARKKRTKRGGFRKPKKPGKSTVHHLALLFLGFIAIVISGYVLSESATNIIDALGFSDMLFGVVVLSIATTLPEKFIAVMSASRNQLDIMCATTVGSNMFILTLCLGVLLLGYQDGDNGTASAGLLEIGALAASTVLLTATVFVGMRYARLIGIAMLALYLAFIVAESYVRS